MPRTWILRILVLALAGSAAVAEDVAAAADPPADTVNELGRWRIGVDLGGFSPDSEVESPAANTLSFFEPDGTIALQFVDPRPDAARFGTLAVQPAGILKAVGQYAPNARFALEASVGYARTDLGDVEMHAQFSGVFTAPPNSNNLGFGFVTYRIPVGEMQIVPLQLSGLARFRPRAPFRPYVGGGVGYQFVGLDISPEFDAISQNLDRSRGVQGFMIPGDPLAASPNPVIFVSQPPQPRDLDAATVDLPDSFTWHVLGGAEYTVSSRWSLSVDLRYTWSSQQVTVGFDGGEDLGITVPQDADFVGSPRQSATYGPVFISEGGLVDGGSLVPRSSAPPGTSCVQFPSLCFFSLDAPDGVRDTGYYYLDGGTFDYTAWQFSIGARYTF